MIILLNIKNKINILMIYKYKLNNTSRRSFNCGVVNFVPHFASTSIPLYPKITTARMYHLVNIYGFTLTQRDEFQGNLNPSTKF